MNKSTLVLFPFTTISFGICSGSILSFSLLDGKRHPPYLLKTKSSNLLRTHQRLSYVLKRQAQLLHSSFHSRCCPFFTVAQKKPQSFFLLLPPCCTHTTYLPRVLSTRASPRHTREDVQEYLSIGIPLDLVQYR